MREIDASGTPLGLLPCVQYASERIEFAAGSRLLLYTDGLTEVFRGEEEFGQESLRKAFLDCTCPDCGSILDCLWSTLQKFSGGAAQEDDMTALAIVRMSA